MSQENIPKIVGWGQCGLFYFFNEKCSEMSDSNKCIGFWWRADGQTDKWMDIGDCTVALVSIKMPITINRLRH